MPPPHCPPPRGGTSVGPVVVLLYLGDLSLALDSVVMMALVGCFDVIVSPLLHCFGLLLRVAMFFPLFGWNMARVSLPFPPRFVV